MAKKIQTEPAARMKIVSISDTHNRHGELTVAAGDVLIHAGDVSLRGTVPEISDFLDWFSGQPHQHKIFIAGNHDFFFERKTAEEIRSKIPTSIVYLNDSGVVIEGMRVWGSPVTPWFYDWAFNRARGSEIREHWDLIPPGTDILVTHGPVFGVLDKTADGLRGGCKDLLRVVEEVKPRLHICGHIHEAYGLCRRGGTTYINASVLNENYELTNLPVVTEIMQQENL
jgi:Icc-related predicted phosphoesterase